ncbi:MAG TPA: peroxiredoxin family protein [Streptosporangiaceae bacterium]
MTTTRNRPPRRTTRARTRSGARGRPRPKVSGSSGIKAKVKIKEERRRQARRARTAALLWSAAAVVLAGVITAAMLVARSGTRSSSTVRAAPPFTLTSTGGKPVSLANYRGHNVVLYFSEGVGCDPCFSQMREFETHANELAKAGITVVPIVMNPANQVVREMTRFGLRTPYLIDTGGTVSRAYHVLGKGMHADLPGHGFVLIDAHGTQRWYGEYPTMYLSTAGLIHQVEARLRT